MACWDKECDSFIVPSWEPQWRLTLTESLHPHFHGRSRRGRSDGKKLSISSTSRTLIGRLGAPSINVLTRSDTPPVCAPFQQTPSPHNVWRTEHTKLGATSPPCSSTSSCSTYGRSQYLKETVFLATSRQQILLPPPSTWRQEYLQVCTKISEFILHAESVLKCYAPSSIPACATSNFPRSG